MAVISGLSVSSDSSRDGGASAVLQQPRSSWALSWPLALGLVLFVWLPNSAGLLADPDSHWHIAVGNWILAHGAVPTVDVYSFTFAGQPWIAKEWLSQVLLALAYNAGGWGGVTVLCAAAHGFAFALMMRLLLRDISPLPAAPVHRGRGRHDGAAPSGAPARAGFPVHADLGGGPGARRRGTPRAATASAARHAGVGQPAWRLHPGPPAVRRLRARGPAGAREASERKTLFVEWAKFGVAAVLVACITPYGPESILVTLRIFDLGDALSMISEWQSPNFQSMPQQELVLLIALYVCLSRGLKLPLVRLLIVLGLLHLFLRYVRNAELLAMLAPLIVAPVLARQWPALRPDRRAAGQLGLRQRLAALGRPAGRNAIALCLVLGAVYAAGLVRFAGVRPMDDTMPVAALDFIREANLQGNVLNHYGFGGFLINAGVKTFIDGRGELYGGDFIKRYVDIVTARGTRPLEEPLDESASTGRCSRRTRPANKLLAHLPDWKRAYGDDTRPSSSASARP